MERRLLVVACGTIALFMLISIAGAVGDQGLSLLELERNFEQANGGRTPVEDVAQLVYDRRDNLPTIDDHALNNDPRFDARVSERIALNSLDMAHDIGQVLLADDPAKRAEVFSPLSIYSAMGLLLLGASGRTFDELMRLMRFDGNSPIDQQLAATPWKIHEDFGLLLEDVARIGENPTRRRSPTNWKVNRGPASSGSTAISSYRDEPLYDYRVAVANGLFVQNGFSLREDYRQAVMGIYLSNIRNLDFAGDASGATNYINSWVNEKTEGKIPNIISERLNPETKVVMASALYFNARWEKTFLEGATGTKNFYPDGLSGEAIQVEMMGNGGRFPYYEAKEYGCRIIGLPYKHNTTTMYIIQPDNSNRNRLRELQRMLTAEKIETMIDRMQWQTAIVLLPKMHISNQVNMKNVLNRLGAQTLFSLTDSDLSLISSSAEQASAFQQVTGTVDQLSYATRAQSPEPDSERIVFAIDDDDDRKLPTRSRRSVVTYKVPSESASAPGPLSMKSFILSKRITKAKPIGGKKPQSVRIRRQVDLSEHIKRLDAIRHQMRDRDSTRSGSENAGLFVDDILHQVDLTVNEKGTEGGAATVTTLFRTGTDVVMRVDTPFMFLIRHDETKLTLFYGVVFEPTV